jgi:hypothetical protein
LNCFCWISYAQIFILKIRKKVDRVVHPNRIDISAVFSGISVVVILKSRVDYFAPCIPELMLPRRNLFIYKLQSVWENLPFAALGKSTWIALQ